MDPKSTSRPANNSMIYVVSGYMRSGTSMMMQCLEAGGMSVVRSDERDQLNNVHSDDNYKPNPNGLYEPSIYEMHQPNWPKQHDGKAVKVVAPFVNNLAIHHYHVVFMRRDSEEIRQSYEAAFGGKLLCKDIDKTIETALSTLRNRRGVECVTEISYYDMLDAPEKKLSDLSWPINVKDAVKAVDINLHRFRLASLVKGL